MAGDVKDVFFRMVLTGWSTATLRSNCEMRRSRQSASSFCAGGKMQDPVASFYDLMLESSFSPL